MRPCSEPGNPANDVPDAPWQRWLDRVSSILELKAAGYADLTQFPARIRQRYYDRLYLTVETWYPPEFVALIEKHYQLQTIVPRPECSDHIETGRYVPLFGECRIMVPKKME